MDRVARVGVLLGLTALMSAACDSTKPPTPSAPIQTTPTVTAVSISGLPAAFVVGESVQLTAFAILPDGTKLDATATANWTSSAPAVATVSATGLLTVTGIGDADVSATVQNVRGTAHVAVAKPEPTTPRFDVSGLVHESAPTDNVLLAGATVGIHFVGCPTCPRDNEETTTDNSGRFTFRGVETAGFTLVVTKAGYETASYKIAQLPRDQQADIGVSPELNIVRETLDGVWQRSDNCVSSLDGCHLDVAFPVHHAGTITMEECATNTFEAGDSYSFLIRGTRANPLDQYVVTNYCPAANSAFPGNRGWSYQAQPGFIYTVRLNGSVGYSRRAVFTHPN